MIDYLRDSDIEVGYTKDISSGGMFIETSSIPKAGSIVFVDFFLPGVRKKFKLKGKVAWINRNDDTAGESKPGIGIEFINLDEDNKNYLNTGIKNIRGNYEDK
jgi:uncharacterized protein (TIGR02266 family)